MTDALLQLVDEAADEVEFIGFDSTPVAEAPADQPAEGARLSATAKPRRRRVAKAHKRTHPVRVMFDDDEFLKLNVQADAQGMALQEFVRRRALSDPRLRARQTVLAAEDLFARDKVLEVTVARILVPLSPDLERRINAYFLPEDRLTPERLRPGLPHLVARLGHFMTGLISPRWSGHRATPPAGT